MDALTCRALPHSRPERERALIALARAGEERVDSYGCRLRQGLSRGNDLVTAVGDPHSRAHGTNESLHLGDFAGSCLAEILMLDAIAQLDPEGYS